MKSINIENVNINYEIKRSARKSITLMVTNEDTVKIKAPYKVSTRFILDFILSKKSWILEEMYKFREIKKELEFKGNVSYLGGSIKVQNILKSIEKPEIIFEEAEIIVYSKEKLDKDVLRQIMIAFLKNQAKKVLKERTQYFEKLIDVKANKITIKDVKSIWGSCSNKNNINYNYRIIMAPIEILDYLVVHELCHILHRNHSKEYWEAVAKYIPNYKTCREFLKKNGYKLII